MNARHVIRRIRDLDGTARRVSQVGSYAKWLVKGLCTITVPMHGASDIPDKTLASIERQAEHCLGKRWLRQRRASAGNAGRGPKSMTKDRLTYTAHYSYDGRNWIVVFHEPDLSTYGRTLSRARKYAREALAVTLDFESVEALERTVDIVDDVQLPNGLGSDVSELRRQRAEADRLSAAVTERTREYVGRLAAAGMPLRDIGEALGVSHQRVAQLLEKKVNRPSGLAS